MFFSTLVIVATSYTKARSHRVFHYLCAAITLMAAIAYFSMASNLGQVPIQAQFVRANRKVGGIPGGTREIFYVRYIDWYVTSATSSSCMTDTALGSSLHLFSSWISS